MRLIVEMTQDQPDDAMGRRALGFYLHVLGVALERRIPLDTTEDDIRDEHGVVIGKWRVEP